jgi:hypothetical protein
MPIDASRPSKSDSARGLPSLSTSFLNSSQAVPSLIGSLLTGTPDVSGNCIGREEPRTRTRVVCIATARSLSLVSVMW